jgi:hypothetical protein
VKGILPVLCVLALTTAASAQPMVESQFIREVRFTGESAVKQLCACLLEARQIAESQGRINFSADVAYTGGDPPVDVSARIWMGSAHAVGRIMFAGHFAVNDSTLRRAMLIYERDLFDVVKLRRSLERINAMGLFEPLTIADVVVARHDDGVTADVTIPLRQRRRRWWSLSGPLIPGIGPLQASIASRLPPWGRGVLDASTYVVRLNLLGFALPIAKAAPLVLERPIVPGQEWRSGFALPSDLSPRTMLMHYGRAHLARGLEAMLDEQRPDSMVVPVTFGGKPDEDKLVCDPPKPRLWWLRRGGAVAANLALTTLMP